MIGECFGLLDLLDLFDFCEALDLSFFLMPLKRCFKPFNKPLLLFSPLAFFGLTELLASFGDVLSFNDCTPTAAAAAVRVGVVGDSGLGVDESNLEKKKREKKV